MANHKYKKIVTCVVGGRLPFVASNYAFAAKKEDGSVITWGRASHGGNSEEVKEALQSGVEQIYSTDYAFAAVKSDGSVVTWGDKKKGGNSEAVKTVHAYVLCMASAAFLKRLWQKGQTYLSIPWFQYIILNKSAPRSFINP